MTTEIDQLPTEGMHIDGVILPGDIDRGGRALLGLTLVFTPAGIEVRSPQPDSDTLVAWSGLLSARCSERTVLPDLQGAAVLECVSESQTIRFLLPLNTVALGQAAYLELAVPHWLALYRDGGSSGPPSGPTAPPRYRTDAPGAAAGSLDEAAWTVGVLSTGPAPNGPSSSSGMTPRQPPTPLPSPPPAPPDEWIPIGEPGPAWVLSPVPAPAFRPDATAARSYPEAPVPSSLSETAPVPLLPPPDANNPWAGLSTFDAQPSAGSANGTSEAGAAGAPPIYRRRSHTRRRTRWVSLAILGVVLAGGVAFLIAKHGDLPTLGSPNASSSGTALAASINLARLGPARHVDSQ